MPRSNDAVMRWGLGSALVGWLVGTAAACGSSEFRCRESSECGSGDTPGFCETNGYCSFEDLDCASQRRYGELSGDLAFMCVPETPEGETESGGDEAADDGSDGDDDGSNADTSPAATSMGSSDSGAGTTTEPSEDSSSGTSEPRGSSDESGAAPQVLSFGERTGADVTNVTRDNYLFGDNPLDNNGSHPDFHVREDGNVVGLLRFDVTALPAAAEIVGVELHVFQVGGGGTGESQIFRLTEDWTEGEGNAAMGISNWTQRTAEAAWTTAGAGLDSGDPAMVASFWTDQEFIDYAVELPPEIIESWRDDPGNNFGIVFRAGNLTGLIGFGSREAGDPATRPLLVVTYQP